MVRMVRWLDLILDHDDDDDDDDATVGNNEEGMKECWVCEWLVRWLDGWMDGWIRDVDDDDDGDWRWGLRGCGATNWRDRW
mmetsp:Transcript_6189/g.8920  ORF Transcript_6189/g.8920 Transcript_6189/m.8920 type:complete len:81 (-) Transcript_6189:97-339(-)